MNNQEEIIKVDKTTLAVVPPVPENKEYTMDYIMSCCAEYDTAIENIKAEANVWYTRRDKAIELGLKTKAELEPIDPPIEDNNN